MNDQVRGAILGAIAALMGWLAITSVGLLVQVSALHVTTGTLKESITENSTRDHRIEEKLMEELRTVRNLLEQYRVRK